MQNVKIRFAYKTGFRRLWAVLSVVWLSVGLWLHFYDSLPWKDIVSFYILPIAIIYALGVAFVWVIEGFASADK